MPAAFKNAGLAVGSLGTIVLGFICTHCIYILVSIIFHFYCFNPMCTKKYTCAYIASIVQAVLSLGLDGAVCQISVRIITIPILVSFYILMTIKMSWNFSTLLKYEFIHFM